MAGNVDEWVQGWYHDDYTDAPTDGSTWDDSGDYRVLRGASWLSFYSENLRASSRSGNAPDNGLHIFGFRCARSLL